MTDQEGQRLTQIVRRGRGNPIQVRRATIIMASSSGTPVSAIARLVAADEDTVRDVIHAFNERGLAALDPRWAGGRPRLIDEEDVAFIVATATTRPDRDHQLPPRRPQQGEHRPPHRKQPDGEGDAPVRDADLSLLEHWRNHPRMGEGERRVLDDLIEQYPTDLSNTELCTFAGYSPTASTVGVILSKLRKLGLVEKSTRRVAPEFMDSIAS